MQNPKSKILKALFAEAKKLGIDQEALREDITPGLTGKRLSKCSAQEVARVLVYIHNRHGIGEETRGDGQETRDGITDHSAAGAFDAGSDNPMDNRHGIRGAENPKSVRYESSRSGLLQEIADLAKQRFGDDYASPLNAFCARFGETDGFRRMRISQMKRVKQRLQELQKEDPRLPPPAPSEGGEVSPAGGGSGGGKKVIMFQKGRKGFYDQLRRL